MPHIYINKTQPGLFKGIVAIALTHLFVSGLILYSVLRLGAQHPVLAYIFISLFFITAFTILHGLYAPHYRWVRAGLLLGMAVILFLSIIFATSITLTLNQYQTIKLAWLVPPWLYWAFTHFIVLAEPPEKSLTEKE